jgi:hypothetical protein
MKHIQREEKKMKHIKRKENRWRINQIWVVLHLFLSSI